MRVVRQSWREDCSRASATSQARRDGSDLMMHEPLVESIPEMQRVRVFVRELAVLEMPQEGPGMEM